MDDYLEFLKMTPYFFLFDLLVMLCSSSPNRKLLYSYQVSALIMKDIRSRDLLSNW